MNKRITLLVTGISMMLGTSAGAFFNTKNQSNNVLAGDAAPSTTYTNGDKATYYNGLDTSKSGYAFLADLRELNLDKRKSTVGYNSMGTTTSGMFKYTDYDPNYVQYDSKGQPYGTRILSFYSGSSTTSWNREHVWPNSRGGGSGGEAGGPYPDADIFMPRPTISSENSDRGNSVYVEGMAHSSNGWDPVTAFGASNVYKSIRGECARIIFYCMTVNSKLTLNDNIGNDGTNMGKLTDLLKWNLTDEVNEREINRNEGGEYLQGNRNAFVDHPEYACKIWGETNAATKEICSKYELKSLSSLSYTGSPTTKIYREGESFDSTGLTVTATYSNNSTENVTNSVVWTPSPLTKGTTSVTGKYTYNGVTKQITVSGITVNDSSTPISVTDVTLSSNSISVKVGKTSTLTANVIPSNASNKNVTWSSDNAAIATVSNGIVTGVSEGSTLVRTTTVDGSKQASCVVTVTASGQSGDTTLVENLSTLSDGDEVYIATGLEDGSIGITGWNGNKDATSSTKKEEWKAYTVEINGGSYYLKDGNDYISNPTDNYFKYDSSSKGELSLDANHYVKFGSRWLSINGSNIRCYKTLGSYTPFFLYTAGSAPVPQVNSISLDKSNVSLSLSGTNTTTLTPTVSAESGANTTIYWSSSDQSVVTVNKSSGTKTESITLTAVGEGNAIITATCGSKTATCTVTVTSGVVSVTGVSLDKDHLNLVLGGTDGVLNAVIAPSNASNKEVSWSSSNESVATVSNGVVHAVGKGTATITVLTQDGNLKATCNVTVVTNTPPTPVGEKKMTELIIDKLPNKTIYQVGEPFDETGLEVSVNYLDGSNAKVTNYVIPNKPDTSTGGSKTVKIFYNELGKNVFTTFDVLYIEQNQTIDEIKLDGELLKTEYFVGDDLLLYGFDVNATLSDGTVVNANDLVTLSYDLSVPGIATVTVLIPGVSSVTFNVTVKEGEPTATDEAVNFTYEFIENVPEEINKVTISDWNKLEHFFNTLDEEAQEVLRNYVTEYSGVKAGVEDKLAGVMTNYDEVILAKKSQGFSDFIGRNPQEHKDEKVGFNLMLTLIVGVVAIAFIGGLIALVVLLNKKKKGLAN